jgi:hypothetical protein
MADKPEATEPKNAAAKNVPASSDMNGQQKPLPPKPVKPKTILIYESESFKSKGKRP